MAGVPPFKAVLVLMVIGDNQIDVRPDCVLAPAQNTCRILSAAKSVSLTTPLLYPPAHRLGRACRPYAMPSSNSSFGHDLSDARPAEDKSTKSNGVNNSAIVVLVLV